MMLVGQEYCPGILSCTHVLTRPRAFHARPHRRPQALLPEYHREVQMSPNSSSSILSPSASRDMSIAASVPAASPPQQQPAAAPQLPPPPPRPLAPGGAESCRGGSLTGPLLTGASSTGGTFVTAPSGRSYTVLSPLSSLLSPTGSMAQRPNVTGGTGVGGASARPTGGSLSAGMISPQRPAPPPPPAGRGGAFSGPTGSGASSGVGAGPTGGGAGSAM